VGWEALRNAAAEELIPQLYARAIDQEDLDPVGDPSVTLETVERGQPVKFTAEVTVRPVVDLADYRTLRIDRPHTEIGDSDVDSALEEVRRRFSDLAEVSRPAQAGDVLRCTLVMRRGEEVLSGGEERDLELDRERLVPGLVDALLGLTPGEERKFPLALPADYPQEELRGVTVEADTHILAIRERALPPLDDALAQRDGSGETLEEMRDRYRVRLVEAAAESDVEHFQSDVLKALRDRVKVDLPAAMVERELDRELADMEVRLAELGLRFDRYLEYTGGSLEKLRAERRPAAADSVRLELALGALATAEQLDVDESQVEHEVDRIGAGRRLSGQDRRRLHAAAHVDLLRRAAAERAYEIAAGGA
jgi:trigger factor